MAAAMGPDALQAKVTLLGSSPHDTYSVTLTAASWSNPVISEHRWAEFLNLLSQLVVFDGDAGTRQIFAGLRDRLFPTKQKGVDRASGLQAWLNAVIQLSGQGAFVLRNVRQFCGVPESSEEHAASPAQVAEAEAEAMPADEFSSAAQASSQRRRRLSTIRAPEDRPPEPPAAAAEPTRSPSIAVPADDVFLEEFKRCLLVTGWPVSKLSSKGVLARRVIKLNARLDTLTWPTKFLTGSAHKIPIASITAINIGTWSNSTVLPADPKDKAACVSIECSANGVHDFKMLDDLDAKSFTAGLQMLKAQAAQEHAEASDDAAVASYSMVSKSTAVARGELTTAYEERGAAATQDQEFLDRFLALLSTTGWPLMKLSHKNVLAPRVVKIQDNTTITWPSAKVLVGSHEAGLKIGHSVKLVDIVSVKVGQWGSNAVLPADQKERTKCVCIEARHENHLVLGSDAINVTHNFLCLDAIDAVTFSQGVYAAMRYNEDNRHDDSAAEDVGGGRARVKTIVQAEEEISDEDLLDEFKGVLLSNGWPMRKISRNGSLLRRVLKLNRAMDTLTWPTRKAAGWQTGHSIAIAEIASISVGQWGEGAEKSKCLRIVDATGSQTFDFMASDELDALTFSKAMLLLMANDDSDEHDADELAASNAALAEYRAEDVSPEDFTDRFKGVLLTSGFPVMRLTHKKKLVERVTRLNTAKDTLLWPTKKIEGRVLGNGHSVAISDIKQIITGAWPGGELSIDGQTVFADLCMAILDNEGSSTCLAFENEVDRATFKIGIEAIAAELATEDACHAEEFEAAQSAMPAAIEADDNTMFDHFNAILLTSGWPVRTLTQKGNLVKRVVKLKDGALTWPTHKLLGHAHQVAISDIIRIQEGTWSNYLWELPEGAEERSSCLLIETHDSMYNLKLVDRRDVVVWKNGLKRMISEKRAA